MKLFVEFIIVVGLFSACPRAIQLHRRTDGPPRVVSFPIERQDPSNGQSSEKLRRRGTVQETLKDTVDWFYTVNVTVGTPPQQMALMLDTGTSDTIVNAQTSDECTFPGARFCVPFGSYSANSSSTYSYISSAFNQSESLVYNIIGDYASETLTLGNSTFQSMQIAIAYNTSAPQGFLGIGYPSGEVQATNGGKVYNNVPMQMVADGLINSNAYSLWLDGVNSSTGNILFGGVDTAKYIPPLMTLPLQEIGRSMAQFPLTLTGLSFGSTIIGENLALAIPTTSGDTFTYLPNDLAQALFQEVGAYYDDISSTAWMPCSQSNMPGTLNFTFTSVTISIPMSELVLPDPPLEVDSPNTIGGLPACAFGVAAAGVTPVQLGSSFLRSAYLVFDIDNNEVSIARTNFNPVGSDVVEIGTGKGAVPNATPVANAVAATAGTTSYSLPSPTTANGPGAAGTATASGSNKRASVRPFGALVCLGWYVLYVWL